MMNRVRPWHAILPACLSLWSLCALSANATYSSFFSFNGANGSGPSGSLVLGSDGFLYGATGAGGDNGNGTIFKVSTSGAITVLHSFGPMSGNGYSINADGIIPNLPLVQGPDGAFYGTTQSGGANGSGTIFKITPGGTFTTLFSFEALSANNSNNSGIVPHGPLAFGADGALYGTAINGGANNDGTLFKITTGGTFTTLHHFTGLLDGYPSWAPLVRTGSVMIGLASGGRDALNNSSNGVFYSIATDGTFTLGTRLAGSYYGPSAPFNSLYLGGDGLLYGQSSAGGNRQQGELYKFDPSAGLLTDLYDFNLSDGTRPQFSMTGPDGNYYATNVTYGFNYAPGDLTQVTPAGAFSILHAFGNGQDGSFPYGALTLAGDGNLYGVTGSGGINGNGTIYRVYLTPVSTPSLTSLSPTSATAGTSSVLITVSGQNLFDTTKLYCNGAKLPTLYKGDGVLSGPIPFSLLQTAGTLSITAITPAPGGGTSNALTFTVNSNLVPAVSSVSPATTLSNVSDLTITLTGSNFNDRSIVSWNNTALTTTYVSPTQVTAIVPAANLTTAATIPVGVVNPAPGGGTSNMVNFTITQPYLPVVTGISPATTLVNSPDTTVTINGSNFESDSFAELSGNGGITPLTTTFVSPTQLTAVVPASFLTTPANLTIDVNTAIAGGGRSAAQSFAVTNPPPVITSITPTVAQAGGPSFVLTVNGTGFLAGGATGTALVSHVYWNGQYLSAYQPTGGVYANSITPTQIQISVSPALIASAGTATITVRSGYPDNVSSNAATLQIVNDPTPPITTATLAGSLDTSGSYYLGPVQTTLSATDPAGGSGVAATYYTVDGGVQQTYTAPFSLSASGTHTIAYWSVDRVGNVEAQHTQTFTINAAAPPNTFIWIGGTAGNNGWYTTNLQVYLVAFDSSWNMVTAQTYYSLDGGALQTYSQFIPVNGDGVHTLHYWSVDQYGNTETPHDQTIDIDTTTPVITLGTLSSQPNAAGWCNGPVSIPFTVTDATSGVASSTPASPLTFTAEGLGQTQTVNATDVAGNSASSASPAINIDLTAPATTAAAAGSNVTLTATDALSGVSATYYTVDGGARQTYTAPFTVPAGVHSVSYWSSDVAGNVETSHTFAVTVDNTPPVTTAALSGTAGSNGWYTGGVQVTLSATDALSSIAATYLTVDGGAQQTYTAPFTVSGDAVHTITFWSVDTAGNTEAANSKTIKIDGTKPSLAFGSAMPSPNAAGWYKSAVTLPYTASDATSGVASTAPGSPLSIATEGSSVTQTVSVTDTAGNAASFTSPAFKIDVTAPATTAAANGATVTLTAADALSGVSATYYTIDGGAQQTYTAPITVAGGAHTVGYWAVDAAGNTETSHSLAVTVDNMPPVTTAALAGTAGGNGWYTSAVQTTLSASDNGSGVASTFYTIDNGAQQTYSVPFAVTGDGTHTVKYWSVDAAGNSEAMNTKTIKIDTVKPILAFGSATTTPNAAGWYKSAVTLPYTTSDATSGIASAAPGSPLTISAEGSAVTQTVTVTDAAGNAASFTSPAFKIDVTAPVTTGSASGATVTLSRTDSLSGVSATYYKIDNGAQQTYSAPFTVTGNGTHTITYWSADNAGNTESAHTLNITVNSGNVTVTPSITSGSSNYWSEEDLSFTSTQTVTALTITITVQRSPGNATYAGEYTNFPGGSLNMSYTQTGSTIVYTYTLKPNKTLSAGAYMTAAQFSLNGTAHPYTADTYTMSVTAGGVTQNFSGAM